MNAIVAYAGPAIFLSLSIICAVVSQNATTTVVFNFKLFSMVLALSGELFSRFDEMVIITLGASLPAILLLRAQKLLFVKSR